MSTETMQWFRLYAGIVDDEKLRLLAFEATGRRKSR